MERVLKKNSKRFWVIILVLAMCIGLALSSKLILNPKAEEPATGTYSDFTYRVENGEVIITRYTGEKKAEVSIPETIDGLPVTEIGDNAFSSAGYLKKIDFGEHPNLKRIGQRAFYECSLRDLYLPDTVTFIGSYAFYHNNALYTVKLPKNLEKIESYAFGTNNTRRIYVPNFTKDAQIGDWIWYHSVDPRYGLTINYSTVATFEDGIEKIPDNMFEGLLSLSWAEIPDSVTSIGDEAFNRCCMSYCTVVIPNSVTSIGENAFASGNTFGASSSRPTIRCYEGSYAETYAIENGVTYKIWDGATRFTYPSTFEHDKEESRNVEAKCYYSDQYFSDGKNNKGSYTYKPSLATMSMALAFSAFGRQEGDYSSSYQNATNLMKDVGMIGTKAYSCNTRPGTDTIGVICGTKYIYVDGKWQNLIVCAIRGGGYGAEWASNFTVGSSGQHQGFNEAKEKVKQYLEGYIKNTAPLTSSVYFPNNPSEPIKIWITGFSRAAAVANLLAADIDSHNVDFGAHVTYDAKDVYTYTFETPAGALAEETKDDQFDNIFNIINPADPVPYLAPSQLGFGRYGVDYYTPAAGVYKNYMGPKARMMDIYDSLPYANNESKKYDDVDNFTRKRLYLILPKKNEEEQNWEANFVVKDDILNLRQTQTAFLTDLSTDVANDIIGSRDQFVVNYEREVRAACNLIYSKQLTNEQTEVFKDTLMEQVKANWLNIAGPVILIGPSTFLDDYNVGAMAATVALKAQLQAEVGNWVQTAATKAKLGFSSYDKDSVVKPLTQMLVNFVAENPQKTTSLIGNASGIKAGHYPELCFSWLASMDKNYNPNAEVTLHKNRWRKLRINCDVNVSVYDSNHNLVAQIKNEKPLDLNNTYDYGIDFDGQKYVILPADEDYTIYIQAYNDTTVNYGISEYSAKAGAYTRDVNYFDIALDKNETLTGEISSYLPEEVETDTMQASHATYTITDSNDDLIKPTSDLKDDDSINASYNVDVKTSDEEQGIVLGSGIHQFGQFAQLEAVAKEGYKFVGWYIDGGLVSTETSYRIRVEKDVEVVGKFAEGTTDPTEPVAPELVSSKGNDLIAKTYTNLELKNAPGEGYEYKFIVYNDSTKQWYKLKDFGPETEFDWYTGPAGVKNLYVDIRNKADETDVTRVELTGVNVTDSGLKATLAIEPEGELAAKTQATLTATATGGTGEYQYKFIVFNATTNQWYKLKDFGPESTFDWYTGPAGTKTLYVDVKDANGVVVRQPLENIVVK